MAGCSYFPRSVETENDGETNEIKRLLQSWPYKIRLYSNDAV